MPVTLTDEQALDVLSTLCEINQEDYDGWALGTILAIVKQVKDQQSPTVKHARSLVVGKAKIGFGTPVRGQYVGSIPRLKSKTALVSKIFSGDGERVLYVSAQFNDESLGYGFGWWEFPEADFTYLN